MTLRNPMDCSLPGSSIHGIFQARVLEWGAIWPYIQVFNHFEFIFVYGVRKCSNFILLHIAVQFSQHHLLKSFLSYFLAAFIIDNMTIGVWVYIWAVCPFPLVYIFVFEPVS